jgi:hypothetical protein
MEVDDCTDQRRPAECHLISVSLRDKKTVKQPYLFSISRRASMHLWTSAISLAGSIEIPDRFPPQMFKRRTIPEVKIDICREISVQAYLYIAWITHHTLMKHRAQSRTWEINKMTTRPRSICTDRQGREGQRWRFARRGDKRSMHENLEVVVICIESCRLSK